MKWRLFVDDVRNPKEEGYYTARSISAAKNMIATMGCPIYISFDHDVDDLKDGGQTGFDLAKWLVEKDLDGEIEIPLDFGYNIHSANPVGEKNIKGLLDNYLQFREKEKSHGK